MTNTRKKLVILDLDETLIHATKEPLDRVWDFEVYGYKVYKRPGLEEFLLKLMKHFEVAVWSSASDEYVEAIVKVIFPADYPLKFVWGRSKCTLQLNKKAIEESGYSDYSHLNYVKMLKKVHQLGFGDLDNMLIVDDTPHKSQHNYGNAIYPSIFMGDRGDNELLWLERYLETLIDTKNIRKIEKRFWRKEIIEKFNS